MHDVPDIPGLRPDKRMCFFLNFIYFFIHQLTMNNEERLNQKQ